MITFSLFGQSKWKFASVFSIDNTISSNYLVTDGSINGYSIQYDKFNYTFGFVAAYKLKTKLSLETGITYSNKDFTGRYNCATCFFPDIYIWAGYSNEIINQRFLQVPMLLKYYVINKKIKLSVKTGLQHNFSVKNTLENKKYYLGGILGSEIGYQIIKNLNLGAEYQYNTSLTNLYEDKDFKLKSNSFFLRIGYGID